MLKSRTMTSAVPAPTVIDLFAGAGGLSLGAARAGFRVAAAVELDDFAFETHIRNFPQTVHLKEDIGKLSGERLLSEAKLKTRELDGIIGGPPCQGFSSLGRGVVEDERNKLFEHFFRLVAEIKPKFFLAENVPNILNAKYAFILQKAFDLVNKDYDIIEPFSAKASDYGAPTTRTRVFFIGIRKDLSWNLSPLSFSAPQKIKPVTVQDALIGLVEEVDPQWQLEEQGIQSVKFLPDTEFSRHLAGDIPSGVGDVNAISLYLGEGKVYGCLGTRHGDAQVKRFRELLPGQKDKVTRGSRLDPNGFCYTIRAGTGKDKGSGQAVRPIHPTQPRVITPREAARLQGFPDWFVFHRTKWHSFRQIGNSVSPIVATSLLSVIKDKII